MCRVPRVNLIKRDLDQSMRVRARIIQDNDLLSNSIPPKMREDVYPRNIVYNAKHETDIKLAILPAKNI